MYDLFAERVQILPGALYIDPGQYSVSLLVSNSLGCTDDIIKKVTVEENIELFIPNTFTPNGDGVNDFFLPQGTGLNWDTFEMYVFDRWGNLIYKTNDINKPWNGKANGGNLLAQIDTYEWKVKVYGNDGEKRIYVGHVNLVR